VGRRSDHTIHELTSMIIDAACKIIEKHGFEKLSTRKIAAEIGYTVGTLYNLFKNLDDIIINVNNKTLDALIIVLNKALADPSEDKIKNIALAYQEFALSQKNLWLLLFEYQFPDNQEFPRWYKEKIDKLFEIVGSAIKVNAKSMDATDTKHSIAVLWSGIHGICLLNHKGKFKRVGINDTQALLSNFIDNYLVGLNAA
jgi:AcrR family transcriptional regulator